MGAKDKLRREIIEKTREYATFDKTTESNGRRIPVAGRVYDGDELEHLIDSSLDFWLTAGRYAKKFEAMFADYLGIKHAFAVNSGSAANLLAFMALTSPLLKERAIKRGDEVISVAASFPTTVSPIIQYGAVPVFVDICVPSYNIDTSKLEAALSAKTKAVFIAHTLGVPFDLKVVSEFCKKNNLWLIEDNCDALGAMVDMGDGYKKTGTIGDIGTSSFYPAHHMTMGEGGAVYTNDVLLANILLSLRDWGRDCVCPPGQDDTCSRRFAGNHGALPEGYDHKYVYSHFGYNCKVTDMQAAIGCAQLRKLPSFIEARRSNWQMLHKGLLELEKWLIMPTEEKWAYNSPFGFVVTVKNNSPLTRNELVRRLEDYGIQTRMLFAGNLTKQPCFSALNEGEDYRIIGGLETTDRVMRDTFWTGVYPGLGKDLIKAMTEVFYSIFN